MKRILGVSLCAASLATSSFATVLFNDAFTYSDGALTTVSGGTWLWHSGSTLQQDVESGMVNLTFSESEDTHANFTAQASGIIWAGADVNFSELPSTAGGYFMHFSDGGTSLLKGRVFATTTGAATGNFRIGIQEASSGAVFIGSDLSLGTTYRILFSTDVATNDSTVEVVGVGSASHSDATAASILSAINFRQATGIGTMKIDNLLVGTTRADVAAVPEPMTIMGLATGALFLARRRKK